jgi:predicted metallopeptidase
MNTIFERVVEESYSQYKLPWVSEVSKIIRQILNIDPGWELKCIKEQFKCLKIEHKVCKCGQQE